MASIGRVAIVLTVICLTCAALAFDDRAATGNTKPGYGKPNPLIGIADGSPPEVEALTKEIAQALQLPESAIAFRGKRNPVCCIWFEINRFTPNPGQAGYMILNQPGGSLVTASNLE